MEKINKKIVVLDMQPIDPPIGGGRLRLLGLYHNLGGNLTTQYIGTYDWPGEKFRDHQLSASLREVDIPLSDEHFAVCRRWQDLVGGKTIIDSTFSQLAYYSKQYVDYVRSAVVKADVVIFSHPWVYPIVKDLLKKDTQIVIYDSQNVEGFLRFSMLDDNGFGTDIVRNVVKTEYDLCHLADVVFACSIEDCEMFNRLYGIPFNKLKIVPNGVFSENLKPVNELEKKSIKHQLGLDGIKAAIFIGSNYPPNLEACHFIINDLAPKVPKLKFIIAGGVGEGINKNMLTGLENVIVTGLLSEKEKVLYLAASDLAINPMFSGSGTSIKMFDFMAAGLPIISTQIGARGIAKVNFAGVVISDRSGFISTLQGLFSNDQRMGQLSEANRELVEKRYSWEEISPKLGSFLAKIIGKHDFDSLPSYLKGQNKKFALMSSWNLRCGIAEHSRYLTNEFEAKDLDFRIITNSNGDLSSSYFIDDISRSIYPLWNYDYINWKDTKIDIAGILQAMHQEEIFKLNIQYHKGFYDQQLLLELVKACVNTKIEVTATLHNSKEMYPEVLLELSKLASRIIVHTSEEETLLRNQGIYNVFHIPLGVLDFADEDKDDCRKKLGISGDPVICSFGFLRPHKGVLEAIEAISILRDHYPNIKFLAVNSLYPSADSEQYLRTCINRINELNLNDNITLITSFLEIDQIIHYLHSSDLIVLPYHESKEGSSAAANTAISARRPLIISKSDIFSEIKNVGYVLHDNTPPTIASEIQYLFSNPELLNNIKDKVVNYVNENTYKKVADKYIELILGED